MAGERRLHRDLGGLSVADLTHHDHVRVLAQNGPQDGGERETCLGVHGHLGHTGELILYRIFHGDDLDAGCVDPLERGVEGGGLAGAGRPGDQDDAVGAGDELLEAVPGSLVHAQFGDVSDRRAPVEQPQHRTLAVHRRQGGNADVDLALREPQADAAVLGQAPLGDVQVRHDLDAADHGGLVLPRMRGDVVEHAVDAVAHPQPPLSRLDVHVGCAVSQRLENRQVHQLDDRCLARECAQVVEGVLLRRQDLEIHVLQVGARRLDRCGVPG